MKAEQLMARVRSSSGRSLGRLLHPQVPFDRLLQTQVLMLAGDALVAIALAGSLFFDISPHAARIHVLLGLGLTFVPFVLIAPVIGPLLDSVQGMRKAMVLISAVGRVALCVTLAGNLKSFLVFPESFGLLVLSKVYGVSRQALVPEVAQDHSPNESYVHANATLNFFGAVAGLAGSVIGLAIWKLPSLGSAWVLRTDALVFASAAVVAWWIPGRGARSRAIGGGQETPTDPWGVPATVAPAEPPRRVGMHEPSRPDISDVPTTHRGLRNHILKQRMAGLFAAASAMAVLRAVIGFLEFLLIFTLRRDHYGLYWFGIVLSGLTIGSVLANVVAPQVRAKLREEYIVSVALGTVCLVSAAAWSTGGMLTEALLMLVTSLAAVLAKVAFDAMVQRDTPEHRRGTTFARFETRFQLVWVAGAVVPVWISFPVAWGDGAISAVTGFAALAYWLRSRRRAPAGR